MSPYTTLSTAMRVVTRTEASEFRQAAGLVGLQPAPHPPQAQVYDLRRERAVRTRHPAAV